MLFQRYYTKSEDSKVFKEKYMRNKLIEEGGWAGHQLWPPLIFGEIEQKYFERKVNSIRIRQGNKMHKEFDKCVGFFLL